MLHWTLVATLAVCALTGLRIAADAPGADTLLMFSAMLPAENIWKLHIVAGVSLMMVALAYPFYMRMSGLTQRIKLDGTRLSRFRSAPWPTINVLLHWLLFALIVMQVVTGILLHRGFGGSIVELHLFATWMILLYVPAHLGSHLAYGGMEQLLRVLKALKTASSRRKSDRPGAAAFAERSSLRLRLAGNGRGHGGNRPQRGSALLRRCLRALTCSKTLRPACAGARHAAVPVARLTRQRSGDSNKKAICSAFFLLRFDQ